jgi:hypothetical protein
VRADFADAGKNQKWKCKLNEIAEGMFLNFSRGVEMKDVFGAK